VSASRTDPLQDYRTAEDEYHSLRAAQQHQRTARAAARAAKTVTTAAVPAVSPSRSDAQTSSRFEHVDCDTRDYSVAEAEYRAIAAQRIARAARNARVAAVVVGADDANDRNYIAAINDLGAMDTDAAGDRNYNVVSSYVGSGVRTAFGALAAASAAAADDRTAEEEYHAFRAAQQQQRTARAAARAAKTVAVSPTRSAIAQPPSQFDHVDFDTRDYIVAEAEYQAIAAHRNSRGAVLVGADNANDRDYIAAMSDIAAMETDAVGDRDYNTMSSYVVARHAGVRTAFGAPAAVCAPVAALSSAAAANLGGSVRARGGSTAGDSASASTGVSWGADVEPIDRDYASAAACLARLRAGVLMAPNTTTTTTEPASSEAVVSAPTSLPPSHLPSRSVSPPTRAASLVSGASPHFDGAGVRDALRLFSPIGATAAAPDDYIITTRDRESDKVVPTTPSQ
jgi:hypothetical protein